MTYFRQVNFDGTANMLTTLKVNCPDQASPGGPIASTASNRALDFVLAVFLLVFMAPLLLLVAILIYADNPGPILFAHRRIGRNGVLFPCLKFRSMAIDAQERLAQLLASDPQARKEWERDHKLHHDPRITPIGQFLRRSSLDELPQLINVIRGEMSLVGPRPITSEERWRYGRYFDDYCHVQPGITGLWQISGRSGTTYRRRVALDVVYARNQSTGLYLAILTKTIPAVLFARGAC
jgi:exopolysaccharide production protein ExoY